MSYTIERQRAVFTFDTGDADACWRHFTLFACESASSNVFPPDWGWHLRAMAIAEDDGTTRRWAGKFLLPLEIWECGHWADNGDLKLGRDRNVDGLTYIGYWKSLAEKPQPLDYSLGWRASFVNEDKMNTLPIKPGVYEPERLTALLAQLPWEPNPYYPVIREAVLPDYAAMRTALAIWRRRKDFVPSQYSTSPFSICARGSKP